jgi:hypothetical protein
LLIFAAILSIPDCRCSKQPYIWVNGRNLFVHSYAAFLLRHEAKISTIGFEIWLLKCEYDAIRAVSPGKQEGQL